VAGIEGSVLSFLIDTTADWVAQARAANRLHATVSDTRGNTYLSLNGRPSFTTDPAVIDELWNPFAGSFFDEGRDDPNIAVLRLDVTEGSYWDGPSGRLGELISVVRAKFGDGDDAGERGRIDA
jgi:general stress protein 26